MYCCTNDRYCSNPDCFGEVEEFLGMCAEVFGSVPVLAPRNGGSEWVDEHGEVVLRRVA